MDTLARAPGGQMRGAATKAMSDIAEERQQRRYAPFAAAPLRAAARRPAGFVARSSHTAWVLLVARALPAGLQQNVKLFLREPLVMKNTRRMVEQGAVATGCATRSLPLPVLYCTCKSRGFGRSRP